MHQKIWLPLVYWASDYRRQVNDFRTFLFFWNNFSQILCKFFVSGEYIEIMIQYEIF